jgi:serine/threonine protein phosphatase 1
MRSYVIGDIHGCLDELRYLVEDLPLDTGDRLVFLGDYIDRGPNSNGVISYLLELTNHLAEHEIIFLKGNHEDMFLSYLGLVGQHGDMFLYNGGMATLTSYGITTATRSDSLRSLIPRAHFQFYENLRSYYLMEPYLCVHAGIHPLKSLKEQTDSELFWIRNRFIYSSHTLPYTVLFGHTPQNDVFYDLPYKVGLDTGLVYGNKLTCLETEEKVLYQIHRGKKSVKRHAISEKWDAFAAP